MLAPGRVRPDDRGHGVVDAGRGTLTSLRKQAELAAANCPERAITVS